MKRASLRNNSPRALSSPAFVPARHRGLLDDLDLQPRGQLRCTAARSTHGSDAQPTADVVQIHRHQPGAAQARAHHLFHVQWPKRAAAGR